MQLLELELKNWRNHGEFRAKFSPGLNVIIGRNGAGKSNVLQAVAYLITGGTTDSDIHNKADNVLLGESNGHVSGVLEIGDRIVHIRRGIAKANCAITIEEPDGEKRKIKSIKKVEEELGKLFGVELKTFRAYAFRSQEDLSKLVGKPDSDYVELLHRIFCLHNIEAMRRRLVERMNRYPIMTASTSATIEELEQRASELTAKLESVETDREHLRSKIEELDVEWADRVLADASAADDARKSRYGVEVEFNSLQRRKNELEAELKPLEDSLAEKDCLLAQTREAYLDARDYVARYGQIRAEWQELQRRKAELQKEANLYSEPIKPEPIDRPIDEIKAEIDGLRAWMKQADDFIRTFKDGICPTCGQRVQDADKLLEEYSDAKIAETRQMLLALEDKLNGYVRAVQSYETNKARYDAWLKSHVEQTKTIDERIAKLKVQMVSDEELAKQREIVALFEMLEQDKKELSVQVAELRADMAGVEDRLNSLAVDLGAMDRIIERAPAEKDIDRANEIKSEQVELSERHSKRCAEAAELKAELNMVERDLEQLRRVSKANAARSKYIDTLTAVRDILHPKCLPHDILKSYLSALTAHITGMLDFFGAPFTVRLDEETLAFVCSIDGDELPSSWLSSGQKYVLAISFIFGLSNMFSRDMGFMTLDEPTAFLDDVNRANVGELFGKIRSMVQQRQLLIVTHDRELLPYADNVIEVS